MKENREIQLTSWISKHAHERREFGRAPAMRNVQPASSWPMNAASGMLASLRRLLLLVHGGSKGQRKGARRVRAGGERCWKRCLAMEWPWEKAVGRWGCCCGRGSGSWSRFGSKRQAGPRGQDRFCQRRVDAVGSSELDRAKERWKGRSRAGGAMQSRSGGENNQRRREGEDGCGWEVQLLAEALCGSEDGGRIETGRAESWGDTGRATARGRKYGGVCSDALDPPLASSSLAHATSARLRPLRRTSSFHRARAPP